MEPTGDYRLRSAISACWGPDRVRLGRFSKIEEPDETYPSLPISILEKDCGPSQAARDVDSAKTVCLAYLYEQVAEPAVRRAVRSGTPARAINCTARR